MGHGILKVTDFGLSGLHKGGDHEVFKTTLGSPNYVAPEVLIGRGYDGFKADIWSSGVILYVLLAGFLPFDEDNANELFKKICTADFRFPQTFSNSVIDLLNNVLVVVAEKRYSLKMIKKHEWFQSAKKEDEYFYADKELMLSAQKSIKRMSLDESVQSEVSDVYPPSHSIKKSKSNININKNTMNEEKENNQHQKRSSLQIRINNNEEMAVSDYLHSDIENNSDSASHPISMTAFDLIGIVSTQMLNNVFTRSLQDTQQRINCYTRFVSTSTPPKILYAIQEAVHRIADSQCYLVPNRYEIKIVQNRNKHKIHINIQIFSTPVPSEYMIECRRTRGNIFKYHDFFEEFQKQYKNVITLFDKKKQIKFRDESMNKKQKKINHSRSVSDYTIRATFNDPDNEELHSSQSQPQNNNILSSHKSNPSITASHHSSVSSNTSSEHKEIALNSSASPTPTHSFSIDDDVHSDSSFFDETDSQHTHNHNNNDLQPVNNKKHRKLSSGTYRVTKTGHLDIPSKVPET